MSASISTKEIFFQSRYFFFYHLLPHFWVSVWPFKNKKKLYFVKFHLSVCEFLNFFYLWFFFLNWNTICVLLCSISIRINLELTNVSTCKCAVSGKVFFNQNVRLLEQKSNLKYILGQTHFWDLFHFKHSQMKI